MERIFEYEDLQPVIDNVADSFEQNFEHYSKDTIR